MRPSVDSRLSIWQRMVHQRSRWKRRVGRKGTKSGQRKQKPDDLFVNVGPICSFWQRSAGRKMRSGGAETVLCMLASGEPNGLSHPEGITYEHVDNMFRTWLPN
ncbi:hypothetical protein B0H65DRAFT_254535 [Neurospora tetraspora]|uniref:Uncharacterized protein n=1 Tax=Neurospora tetraspora TaxID=94610 RepID=A0AAE0MP64_9PEZI|nr:hypothetical protein B0H65DRAFT_254535 [Neurospora tetraspora]